MRNFCTISPKLHQFGVNTVNKYFNDKQNDMSICHMKCHCNCKKCICLGTASTTGITDYQ